MYEKLGLFYPASPFFRPYQYISHMFMHGNLICMPCGFLATP
jgi:membrane associated rhomboid family serine protease